jgi:hypothetical protein
MPIFAGLGLLLALGCAIHAGKTGRPFFWIYLCLFLPGIGPLAYLALEVLPELFGTRRGRQATSAVVRAINPEKTYRALHDEVETAPTVENMRRLAEECVAIGRFAEAIALYRQCLTGMYASDPALLLPLAQAQFAAGQHADARATLDQLRAANPDFDSADGHLLYARTLEALGDDAGARREYEALIAYYPGPEATCRYALLLQRVGETQAAASLFTQVKRQLDRAPRHVRAMHREWHQVAARNA